MHLMGTQLVDYNRTPPKFSIGLFHVYYCRSSPQYNTTQVQWCPLPLATGDTYYFSVDVT